MDSTPTLRVLDDKVVPAVAAKWDTLSIHLGVDTALTAIVKKNNPTDCEGACRDVLSRWLKGDRNSGSEPRTWRSVLQAVRDCGYREYASELEKEFEESSAEQTDKLFHPVLLELQQADLITHEERKTLSDPSGVVQVAIGKTPEVMFNTATILNRNGFKTESKLLAGKQYRSSAVLLCLLVCTVEPTSCHG